MSDTNQPGAEAPFDPFSMEQAYKTYQNNIRRADELIYAITKGARGDTSEHELLLMAVEAISRMTDNTAFRTVVERSLAERSGEGGAS